MPDFALSDDEAGRLASFLRSETPDAGTEARERAEVLEAVSQLSAAG